MSDAATLPLLLKGLRLPTFARQWKPLAERAESQGWSVTRYLAQLCELETAERQTLTLEHCDFQLNAAPFQMCDAPSPGRGGAVTLRAMLVVIADGQRQQGR